MFYRISLLKIIKILVLTPLGTDFLSSSSESYESGSQSHDYGEEAEVFGSEFEKGIC